MVIKKLNVKETINGLVLQNSRIKIALAVRHLGHTQARWHKVGSKVHYYNCKLDITRDKLSVIDEEFRYYGSIYDYERGKITPDRKYYLNIIYNFLSDITFLESEDIETLEEYLEHYTDVKTMFEGEMTKEEIKELDRSKKTFNTLNRFRNIYRHEINFIYEIFNYLQEGLGAG